MHARASAQPSSARRAIIRCLRRRFLRTCAKKRITDLYSTGYVRSGTSIDEQVISQAPEGLNLPSAMNYSVSIIQVIQTRFLPTLGENVN